MVSDLVAEAGGIDLLVQVVLGAQTAVHVVKVQHLISLLKVFAMGRQQDHPKSHPSPSGPQHEEQFSPWLRKYVL